MEGIIENPLHFFEYIIDETNINKEIEKQINYYDFASYNIELPGKIQYVEQNDLGEYKKGEIEVIKILLPQLRKEFHNSKKRMLEIYLQNNSNDNPNFLRYQFNTIQSLIYNSSNIINKYPYLLLPLRGLVRFINDKLLLLDMERYVLNEDGIQYTTILNQETFVSKSNSDIIHDVLSFMNGKNEKQEEILSKEDYNLLIEYTTHLIEKGGLPTFTKQLKPNLTNDVVRFSFWVLHKELYTTTKIRPYFYDFIKLVFENFKDNEISSIRSQFGTKSRVKLDSFLPETIKNYLIRP